MFHFRVRSRDRGRGKVNLVISSFCKEKSLADSMVFVPSFSFILSHQELFVNFIKKKRVSDNIKWSK